MKLNPMLPPGFPIIDLSEHSSRPALYPLTMEDLYFRTMALEVFKKQNTVHMDRVDYKDTASGSSDTVSNIKKLKFATVYVSMLTLKFG